MYLLFSYNRYAVDVVFSDGLSDTGAKHVYSRQRTARCIHIRKLNGLYYYHMVKDENWAQSIVATLASWVVVPFSERDEIKKYPERFLHRLFHLNAYLDSIGEKTLAFHPTQESPIRPHIILTTCNLYDIVNHLRANGNPVIPFEALEEGDRATLGEFVLHVDGVDRVVYLGRFMFSLSSF